MKSGTGSMMARLKTEEGKIEALTDACLSTRIYAFAISTQLH